MKHTIRPSGKSLGIIAVLVMALVFSFAALSCETSADGRDGRPGDKVHIDKDGYWAYEDGTRVKDPIDNSDVRAFMRYPEPGDFNDLTNDQLRQYYGNVKELTLTPLPNMSKGAISFKYQKIEDFADPPCGLGEWADVSDEAGLQIKAAVRWTSEGVATWQDFDGQKNNERAADKIGVDKNIIKLDPGTYRVFFSITVDNKHYFQAENVYMGDDVVLTVLPKKVEMSDFEFVPTICYTGDPVTYDAGEDAETIDNFVKYICAPIKQGLGTGIVTKMAYAVPSNPDSPIVPPTDVGVYKVWAKLENLDTDYWYAEDADGNTATSVLLGPWDLEIVARYPNGNEYTMKINNVSTNEQPAYRLNPAGPPRELETLPPDAVAIGTAGNKHYSSGPVKIKSYRSKAGTSPVYNESPSAPYMPGEYIVTFSVDKPLSQSDLNWLPGDIEKTMTLTIPEVSSIAVSGELSGATDESLEGFLYRRPPSTKAPDTSNLYYKIEFTNISSLGGAVTNIGSVGYVLTHLSDRYVYLDFSDINPSFTGGTTDAFNSVINIYGVKIGDNVTAVGNGCFANCINLGEVDLGSGVVTIGEYAFAGTVISEIRLPDTVTEIKMNAFQNCVNLATIRIPANVSIGSGGFPSDTFTNLYNGNGGQAGTYVRQGATWVKLP